MSLATRKPNSANLQVRREPTVLERLAENYGEAMALEIQARQEQGLRPFSSLADNSQLEPWEIEELREAQVLKAREERKARFEQFAKAGLKKIDGPYQVSVQETPIHFFVQKNLIWLLASELFQFLSINQKEKEKALQHITSAHIRNVPEGTQGIPSTQLLITLEGAEIAASLCNQQQQTLSAVRQAISPRQIKQQT